MDIAEYHGKIFTALREVFGKQSVILSIDKYEDGIGITPRFMNELPPPSEKDLNKLRILAGADSISYTRYLPGDEWEIELFYKFQGEPISVPISEVFMGVGPSITISGDLNKFYDALIKDFGDLAEKIQEIEKTHGRKLTEEELKEILHKFFQGDDAQ